MKNLSIRQLVRIDAFLALTACLSAIGLKSFLAPLFNLSENLLTTLGLIAFVFACYSFYLAKTNTISQKWLNTLVVGNAIYGLFCLVLLFLFRNSATNWGIFYLCFDFTVIAVLVFFEYNVFIKKSI